MNMTREELIQEVNANKIIVILRGLNRDQLLKTVASMEKGGIRLVEVTFDQSKKISDEETALRILSAVFSCLSFSF